MLFNYIVANYIGPLRTYAHYQNLFNKDPLYFFKKHLDFLQTTHNPDQVFATFVFNDDIDPGIKQQLDQYYQNKFTIVYRKNSGFSYGIWNDVIEDTLNDYDYFFLIEDDYIPTRGNFLTPFVDRCKEDVAFVCGLADTASSKRFPGHVPPTEEPFIFPSISNGLISAKACREIYNEYGAIFKINANTDYWSAYTNQIYFCKHFTDKGYKIADILDEYQSPYNNANIKDVVIYGNPAASALIEPIQIPFN